MTPDRRSRPRPAALASLLVCCAALAAACVEGGDATALKFTPRSTRQGAVVAGPVVLSGRWLAYLADEASTGPGGTDFNGDGTPNDAVAAVVDMVNRVNTVLNVAAQDLAVIGAQIYLVTDEARDGVDWDGDLAADDLVLLHWSKSAGAVTFVATLDPAGGARLAIAGGRLYFVDLPAVPPPAPRTTLNYVSEAMPTTPTRVTNADLANSLAPRILGADEELVFLYLDEAVEMRDLNGDGDPAPDDGFVLALLDGTDPAAPIRNAGLALQDADQPFRARMKGPNDWLVAFLVDELAQGATDLNDPGLFSPNWSPPQCPATADGDTDDEVLHFLHFALWVGNPLANPPVNTGLVGHKRVLAIEGTAGGPGFVATISPEAGASCDLNGDTDTTDDIPRWVEAEEPVLPFGDAAAMVALADLPGGTRGLSDLNRRLIAVVDEAADGRSHDDRPADDDLIAWLNPELGAGASWVFDHSPASLGVQSAGVTWLAERPERDRLLAAFQEAVVFLAGGGFGLDINGDGDTTDSIPTLARFDAQNANDLDFPGPAIAIDADNAGLVIARAVALYRVDEAADKRDWNGGGMTHFVLLRTTVATMQNSTFISTLNALAGPAAFTDGVTGAAFLARESMASPPVDFNQDGDTNDTVLRWMRID